MPNKATPSNPHGEAIEKLRRKYNWDLRRVPGDEFTEAVGGDKDKAEMYLSWIHKEGHYNTNGNEFWLMDLLNHRFRVVKEK